MFDEGEVNVGFAFREIGFYVVFGRDTKVREITDAFCQVVIIMASVIADRVCPKPLPNVPAFWRGR